MARGIDFAIEVLNEFYGNATYQRLVMAVTMDLTFSHCRIVQAMIGQEVDGVKCRRGYSMPQEILPPPVPR